MAYRGMRLALLPHGPRPGACRPRRRTMLRWSIPARRPPHTFCTKPRSALQLMLHNFHPRWLIGQDLGMRANGMAALVDRTIPLLPRRAVDQVEFGPEGALNARTRTVSHTSGAEFGCGAPPGTLVGAFCDALPTKTSPCGGGHAHASPQGVRRKNSSAKLRAAPTEGQYNAPCSRAGPDGATAARKSAAAARHETLEVGERLRPPASPCADFVRRGRAPKQNLEQEDDGCGADFTAPDAVRRTDVRWRSRWATPAPEQCGPPHLHRGERHIDRAEGPPIVHPARPHNSSRKSAVWGRRPSAKQARPKQGRRRSCGPRGGS